MSAVDRIGRPLRVCYPFIGNNVGGSHLSTLLLVKNLDRSRVEPCVVLHEEGLLSGYMREQKMTYELVAIPGFFRPPYWSLSNVLALAAQTWRLAAFLRKRGIDIVHANDVRTHFGWTLATRLTGTKLVWHQRTASFGSSTIKLFLAKLAQQVVCISHYTASTLPQSLGSRARIVSNPFDTGFAELDRQAARQNVLKQLALDPETRIVGFFGNLVHQKRPATFLRTAAKLIEGGNRPLSFLMFGTERNNAQAELGRLAEALNIGGRVHFMGFQTPIEPWMAGCDLMIATGVDDGLGRSLVEAMISGTPVVAADSGGHCEVIEDGRTGWLATADDPDALAAAAGRVLDDPGLAQATVQRAQAQALARYSVQRHVSEMTAIYLETLGRCRKGSPGYPLTGEPLS
ncbi:glycosyltransferase family 4 protein [Pelagibius sp.]|uniref:glycosyltransferase family 4 protein n=1 Tax=Pelagibius sp. TaxID=1931238 RepID=UPI00260F7863|nr:glycosyltransferase family 4 protein [Pelagibius sp.]